MRRPDFGADQFLRLAAGRTIPVPDSFWDRHGLDAAVAALKPGEHLWIMLNTYRCYDPASTFDPGVSKYLDMENLLSINGPGCYMCETPWSAELEAQPCPGDPDANRS